MKISSLIVMVGLLLCAGLGIALMEIKADIHALAARQSDAERHNAALKAELVTTRQDLRDEVKNAAAKAAQPDRWRGLGRIPADRIRLLIAPTLAALEAAHAARPSRPRQPPPPTGPMGDLFPELMGEPHYNLLAKKWQELLISLTCRPRLEQAGVPPHTVDRVLDLLAEQRMIELDYQSLRAQVQPYGPAAYAQQETAVAKIDRQIRAALGQPLFDRLSSPVSHVTTTVHADGTVTETTDTTREIEPYGTPSELALQPLETRLSYSPEPLSTEQKAQLAGVRHDHVRNGPFLLTSSDALKLPDVRAVLTPFQLNALAELNAEHEAMITRSRLPGS